MGKAVPLAVIVVLAVAGIWVDRVRDAKRSELSGVFEAQPSRLASRVGGRVAEILVREGDVVRKGQPLVRLEADPAAQDAASARAEAAAADLRSREVAVGPRAEELARQRAAVAELESNLRLLREGARPEDVAIARRQLGQAQAALDLAVAGPRREDVAAAGAEERRTEALYRAAQRGPTLEERRQAELRAVSARAQAEQAERDAERARALYEQGALPRQAAERASTAAATARAVAAEAEQAALRAERGTPPEELEAARQAFEAARAKARAVEAGSRPEEVARLRAARDAARSGLDKTLHGARAEELAAAEARVWQARAVLTEMERGATPEQLGQAEQQARASQAQAERAGDLLDERVVAAPADGVVERVLVAEGDLVASGQAVVQFADPLDIWLRVYLPEAQLAKVAVDDTADLSVDGVPGVLKARVERIATQGEFTPANLQTPEERGKQVYAVRLRLVRPDERVKAGMLATVKRVGRWP